MHSIIEVRRTGWGPSKHLPKLRENQSTQISWFVIWELRNRNLISLGRWPWARHKLPISVGGSPCYWSHYAYRAQVPVTLPPCHHATNHVEHLIHNGERFRWCSLSCWHQLPACRKWCWNPTILHFAFKTCLNTRTRCLGFWLLHLSWSLPQVGRRQTRFPKCESVRETNVSSCFICFIPNFRPWGVPVW